MKDLLTQAHIEWLGRTLAVWAGSLISPSWHMLRMALTPYLDFNELSAHGPSMQLVLSMSAQMKAHGAHAVLGTLFPSLLLCLVFSFAFIFFCSYIGQSATRFLLRRYQRPGCPG